MNSTWWAIVAAALAVLIMAAETKTKAPSAEEPVIVVGGGLAGLSASLEVLRAGGKLILIDSEPQLGGNSAKASSGISACNTPTQEKLGIHDSRDLFFSDTMSAGDRENDPVLVDILVDSSASAVEFLEENGVDLGDVNLCGGHSVPRTHWIPSPKEGKPLPVGFGIIKALRAKLEEIQKERPDDVQVLLKTRVLGLTSWNQYITGVRVQKGEEKRIEEINGKAVVLTTGGFSSDLNTEASLVLEFAPEKAKFPTTNGPFARGDGVKMARAMGAEVIGMNRVQIHPTAFIDSADPAANTKFLAAEALRGKGAILLNSKGKRFTNELGRRDYNTKKILDNCEPLPNTFQGGSAGRPAALMLMTDETADAFGRPAFNFYAVVKKFFIKYENAAAIDKALGLEEGTVAKTLDTYNTFVNSEGKKKKDAFDKSVFPFAIHPDKSIYVALITPAIHYTMGGLKINQHAQVWNSFSSEPFKGLLAAGEVTGGVHGSNRLAGNSLLECVVYGRIAGKTAVNVSYAHEEL